MIKKSILIMICVLLMSALTGISFAVEENYIEIYDRAGLEAIAQNPNGSYILMADINMAEGDWYPIEFNGTFDGNNHTIYNLSITQTNENPSISVDGNKIIYETYYAALFSKTENAVISNLNLLNVDVLIDTENNCFAAGLVGHGINTDIINCSVQGRIYLYTTSKNAGVAGVVGFGYGNVNDTKADVTLVFVDENKDENCEEFLGGILGCGYFNVENCTVVLDGYASIYGYAHNGGLVGLDRIHTEDRGNVSYVQDNSVDAKISFFECARYRYAFCKAYVGEKMNIHVVIQNNTTVNYECNEVFEYDTVLLPEMCENPEYEAVVTEPTCTEMGYTTYTCKICGYSYVDDYTAPAHTGSEWKITKEPTYDDEGLKINVCTGCGEVLDEETIPKLVYVASCEIDKDMLEIVYKESAQLTAEVLPDDAHNKEVTWSSSDNEVVTVDNEGNVYGASRGTAVITCKSFDGGAQSDVEVTVKYSFKQWLIMIFLFGWLWY